MSSVRCLDSSETKYPVTQRPLPQQQTPMYTEEKNLQARNFGKFPRQSPFEFVSVSYRFTVFFKVMG